MTGHVQADGPGLYLLHGWKDNEDEDVDVDSLGGSSDEAAQCLNSHSDAIPVPSEELGISKYSRSGEALVQRIDQEYDSLVAKSRIDTVRTSNDVENIPNQMDVVRRNDGKQLMEESARTIEHSGLIGNSSSQSKKLNAAKRLDTRRFIDHFAAKLAGSRNQNIVQGKGQIKVNSAASDRGLSETLSKPLKEESVKQAAPKTVNDRPIVSEEPDVMLHVNLEVEQEKGVELPCSEECNVASKESFQVFTRKRKQASEGALQNEKCSDPEPNEVQVESINDMSSCPKDYECNTESQSGNQMPNTIAGRSKRARKHSRQTDYIPWSDFGRLPVKKNEGNKEVALTDSAAGAEVNSRQKETSISLENILEGNSECNKEIGASSNVSHTKDVDPDDEASQTNLETSLNADVVEKEVRNKVPANEDSSSCQDDTEVEVFSDKSSRSSTIHVKTDCQDPGMGAAKNCTLSDGIIDSAEARPAHQRELLSDNAGENLGLHVNVNDMADPKTQTNQSNDDAPGLSKLHSRDHMILSQKKLPGVSDHSNLHQDGIKLPGDPSNGDQDSVCSKCKQGGQLVYCDGKNCKVTFHINCLEPPLRDVPLNDWYCPSCAYKRIFGGLYSVSRGIESIWDMKIVNVDLNRGAETIGGGKVDVKQPEATPKSLETASSDSRSTEKSYFVKYKGVAHAHNQWLKRSQLLREAANLLMNFEKQVEQGKAPKWDPQWAKPFRIIGKRKTMFAMVPDVFPSHKDGVDAGHCIEWFVKWKNLGYEACTWEVADSSPINSDHSKKLIMDYETRSAKAMQRCHAEDTSKVEPQLSPNIQSGLLMDYPSLSEVLQKLIAFWKKKVNSIAVNEIHQDRMKTAIGFLLYLSEKCAISRPCCVVVSSLLLGEWRAALKKWMPTCNMVVYAGSKEARKIIQRYEFCDENGFCMVQIVLTSFDILNQDIDFSNGLTFGALIIDECQGLKGMKACKSLRQFPSLYRLLLLSEPLKNNVEDYQYIVKELAGEHNGLPLEDNVTLMQLKTIVSKYIVQEVKQESSSPKEFWVPIKMTYFQLEQYCKLLVENHDSLVRGKRGDIVSSPQELLLKLRECCNHPFLVRPGLQESLTNLSAKELLDFGIRASGKLKFLDKILWEARSANKRVVIITQIHLRAGKVSVMDVLDDYMRQQFGVDSYERLDGGGQTGRKSAAVHRFNTLNSKIFVFLLDRRACASSIKPQAVNCIVIFDSDWNPQTEIQSFLRMYSPGELEQMAICRFYCTQTVEERILMSARKHSYLDSNQHNFTLAACQKILRWGASKNFEFFDKVSKDKSISTDEFVYSPEMINYFLGKGAMQSVDEVCASNLLFRTALFPRRAGKYSGGLPLYGEEEKFLKEEERVPVTEFWTNLLKDRHLETPDFSVRELRTRKKVQYHEDRLDISIPSQISPDEEEESRRKRRKVAEVPEPSSLGKGGKAIPNERSPPVGVDGQNLSTEYVERPNTNKVDDMQRAALHQLKAGSVDIIYSPSGMDKRHATKSLGETTKPTGNAEAAADEAANNESAASAKSEQQQLLLSMKPDLKKLCQVLQFQADTAEHVEQLLFSVGNFFKLPKDKSLLHAIELSLCWLAAEQQHYCIDRRATLSLAESCFGVQLDKIGTVYAKLEERWKERLEQGAQQSQGTKGQEKDSTHGDGEQNKDARVPDQELHVEKHGLTEKPAHAGALENSCVEGEELSAPKDIQHSKQGPDTSGGREQQPDSSVQDAPADLVPSQEQVQVEPAGIPVGIQSIASLEHSTDANRSFVSQQQRNERSHLINIQKIKLEDLEQLEQKYKQRLKQHYELATAKSKTLSAEERSILLEGWKTASSGLTKFFRVTRANLIKRQNEDQGKEHRQSIEHSGQDRTTDSLNRVNDFSEHSILTSLPQWLRTIIDTGDFHLVRTTSALDQTNGPPLNTVVAADDVRLLQAIPGLDQTNCPPPTTVIAGSGTSVGSSVPSIPQSQPTSSALNNDPVRHPGQQGVADSHGAASSSQPQSLSQQHRQIHDTYVQQQQRPSTLSSDPICSPILSSSASQNQQRQNQLTQQQQLQVTHTQTQLTSVPRPTSPIPPLQQPSLSQPPSFPQQSHLVRDAQQPQPLQRNSQVPTHHSRQATHGSGQTLTLPNEATHVAVSATYNAPHSSVRIGSGATAPSNRILPSTQSRSSQQYDPLAQEFLRLRKEQDKLKTMHESEKERIKAQFMRELELLSKRYEVMLQEEEATFTQKSSALESNLKKVEMNRRLAEVFRLKNAQDSAAVNSGSAGQEARSGVGHLSSIAGAAGQEARSGLGHGQSYQHYQAYLVGRTPPASAAAGFPPTSGVVGGPLFERPARLSGSNVMGAQLTGAGVGAAPNSSWHQSQGLNSNIIAGHSPQPAHIVSTGGLQQRSTLGASVQGSFIDSFRIASQLSPSVSSGVQRLSTPMSNCLLITTVNTASLGSTPQIQDSQGFNVTPMGSSFQGGLNVSLGGSHSSVSTSNVLPNLTSATTQFNSLQMVADSVHITPATLSPARAQQENFLPFGIPRHFSEHQRNDIERLPYDASVSERSGPLWANSEEPQTVQTGYVTSITQASHGYSSTEAPITSSLSSPNVQNDVINTSGSLHRQHFSESQTIRPSDDVICLSDDD